jgi:hypothetical protein
LGAESSIKIHHRLNKQAGLLFCLVAFILLAITSFDNFQVGAFTDDATYIVLARSLAHGVGYTLSNFPQPIRETTFPPGYPLLLAPLVYLWPNSFVPLKLLSLLATVASIALLWQIAVEFLRLRRVTAWVVTLLFAVHPWVIGAASMVMSEAVYTCLTLITIWLIWRYEKANKSIALWAMCVAVMLVLTAIVRTIGLALTVAAFLYLGVVQRKFRHLMVLIAAWILAYVPVFVFNRNGGGGVLSPGYVNQTIGASAEMLKLEQMATNLWSYLSDLLPSLILPLPRLALALQILVASVIMLLLLAGIQRFSRQGWLLIVYLGVYALGVLSFWNPATGNAQTRFLLPVVPLILLLVMAGLEVTQQWLLKIVPLARHFNHRAASPYVIVLIAFVMGAIYMGRDVQAIFRPAYKYMTDLSIGTSYISQHSNSDAIVACQDPIPMYLYADRKTIYYPSTSSQSFSQGIMEGKANFVIVAPRLAPKRSQDLDAGARDVALPAIQSRSDMYRLVFYDSANNVSVFEVLETGR